MSSLTVARRFARSARSMRRGMGRDARKRRLLSHPATSHPSRYNLCHGTCGEGSLRHGVPAGFRGGQLAFSSSAGLAMTTIGRGEFSKVRSGSGVVAVLLAVALAFGTREAVGAVAGCRVTGGGTVDACGPGNSGCDPTTPGSCAPDTCTSPALEATH